MEVTMIKSKIKLRRRDFISKSISFCAISYLSVNNLTGFAANESQNQLGRHKFDDELQIKLTYKQKVEREYINLIEFIQVLQTQMNNNELIILLKSYSKKVGETTGTYQASTSAVNSFESFVANFRPPNYENTLTFEVIKDTENEFELQVKECIWCKVFQEFGVDGEIGNATICNMDYHWIKSFNPDFKMERTKTLMQGDNLCNHKYINTK